MTDTHPLANPYDNGRRPSRAAKRKELWRDREEDSDGYISLSARETTTIVNAIKRHIYIDRANNELLREGMGCLSQLSYWSGYAGGRDYPTQLTPEAYDRIRAYCRFPEERAAEGRPAGV